MGDATKLADTATIAREEIFGPLLTVIAADDERHDVEIANDSISGLNAAVFTDDPRPAVTVRAVVRDTKCSTG
ncbi:MAG TPA: aldehyde dehydrogenase family protein [Sporichthyaceae bacterium]|jgi:acyl-CoA reductase-like NAD-dependent aldehyde dehydrogenase|nr:aldehyde dehydrogenase family protein [Sporichthyaceae bacterium]